MWVPDQPKNRTPLIVVGVVSAVAVVALIATLLIGRSGSNGRPRPSADEQIRAVIASLQDSIKRNDHPGFLRSTCARMHSMIDGRDLSQSKQAQETINVEWVKVNGDGAQVGVEKIYRDKPPFHDTWGLIREDGEWKVCTN